MEKHSRQITIIVFVFALSVVLINLVSLLFPALLVTSVIGSERDINSFELGAWTVPFLSANLAILVFGILYYRRLLPNIFRNSLKSLFNFEVSKKISIIVFSIIIGLYITLSVGELSLQEIDTWHDWQFLGPIIEQFPYGGEDDPSLKLLYVKNFFLYSSQQVFQNVKIIPFIGSISVVFLTYFLTVQIAKKRFAGLVAMVILLQSHTFLRYDTTATFSNFWTAFYLVSLLLVYKKWPLSPLAYIASIFSKTLTVLFLPMSLFFIFRSTIAKKTKILLTIPFVIIFVAISGMIYFGGGLGYSESITSFESEDFFGSLSAWAFQLRIDGVVLVFLLPLTVGLFIKSYQGIREADSILVMIAGMLLAMPLLASLLVVNIEPYRWIPLIAFFAIGVGVLLSKTSVNRPEY